MPLPHSHELVLERFLKQSNFNAGAVVLDLDGTALLEDRGKIFISGSVEKGLREVRKLNRPVILNTLRFPLSVMRTVAREWIGIYEEQIPAVLLNGSQVGFITHREDKLHFEEVKSFPLMPDEIDEIVEGIRELVDNNIRDIILFYYPRDWREGEVIWTPERNRIEKLSKKFLSATEVVAWEIGELHEKMKSAEPCMALVLVDRAGDTLMAYQHNRPSTFYTSEKVDKRSGLSHMAEVLGISLEDSVGAGDTLMDSFLEMTGLSVIVGNDSLPYKGVKETVAVKDPIELGELVSLMARLARSHMKTSTS
jgi:hydroxymethylpyrimidine pyrophosphatase-like HAD family hydrolase